MTSLSSAAQQPTGRSPGQRRWLYALAIAAVLGGWLLLALTHLDFFAFEDDEGTFLMTARSVWEGHALYREVWFNYLAGLMHLLRFAFWLGGTTVVAPRVLIAVITVLTMLVASEIARRVAGRLAGFLTVLLLAITPATARMGRSVMAEVPAALCGALAVLLLLQHLRSRRLGWLALSGLTASVGIWFKYPAALLLVILVVGLWADAWQHHDRWQSTLARSALLLACGILPALLSTLAYELPAQWEQIVVTYLRSDDYDDLNVVRNLGKYYGYLNTNNWGLAALAAVGLVALFRRQRNAAYLLGAWLGGYVVAMLFSTPLGTHHMYLFLAPLAILAAIGLASLPGLVRVARKGALARAQRWPLVGAALATLLLLALLPQTIGNTATFYRSDRAANEELYEAVALVAEHTQPGDYVVSDLGMITYRAGRSAPPWLTNTSGLRFFTGSLTEPIVQEISAAYAPAAVVFWEEKFTDHAPHYVADIRSQYVEIYRQYQEQDESYYRLHGIYLRPDRAP
ncbi:MAG: glycosyltransferase family 39 protein [Anaerolineales bacterium]